jgi:hypothetical protein
MSFIDQAFLESNSIWSDDELQQLKFTFPSSLPAYYLDPRGNEWQKLIMIS